MAMRVASIVLLSLVPASAAAQVVLSEVMYDLAEGSDGGREWVEVYNEGSAAIDLTEWKFFEGNTNHGISATAGSELSPGAYAVIADNPAKFKTDWPSFSGLLFDSAFSLNNTGETLGLRCCGKELSDKDSIAYTSSVGGAGDGNSLSRSGSSFVVTSPTPGGVPSAAKSTEKKEEPPPAAKKLPEPPPPPPPPLPAPEPEPEAHSVAIVETKVEEAVSLPKTNAKPKPVAKITPKDTVAEEAVEDIEEKPVESEPIEQVAAVSESLEGNTSDIVWFLGAGAIALFGAAGGYLLARKRKTEWDIIEEK